MKCTLVSQSNITYQISKITCVFYRRQVWVSVAADAPIVISKQALPLGTYTLNLDNVSLKCNVIQSQQIDSETCYVWLRGCVGDINKLPNEKQFLGPTLGQVVRYLVSESGCTISTASDTDVLNNRNIGQTYTINNTTKIWRQLMNVCDISGCIASSDSNGNIIIKGKSNNTTFIVPKEYTLLPNDSDGGIRYWIQDANILPIPGQKLNDQIIERVVASVTESGFIVSIYFVDQVDNEIGQIEGKIKNKSSYRAIVVTQLNDWSLKVRIIDKRQGIPELAVARIRYGSPLLTSRVTPGTLVSLHLDSAGEIYVDGFESKYTSEALQGIDECVFVGSPSEARPVARTSDGVISYMPDTYILSLFTSVVTPIPIYPAPTGNVPGQTIPVGYIDPLITQIKLTPIQAIGGSIQIAGLIKTGTNKIKAE